MSNLNDKDLADRLKKLLSQSNLTRSGGKNYANSEEIPLGGGGSDREQIIKNRRQRPNKNPPGKNIKYCYITGGRTPNRTALYVAGYPRGVTTLIDEWDNSELILLTATIDNLGSTGFIVSYVLGKQSSTYSQSYECIFKVARNQVNLFNRVIPDRYHPGLNIVGTRLPNSPGFASVGYGNWVNNAVVDLEIADYGNPNFVPGDVVFRLSALSINPKISTELDLLPYIRSYLTPPYGLPVSITPEHTYLTPEREYEGYIVVTPEGVLSGYPAFRVRQDTTVCIRYNATSGKSLSYFNYRNDIVNTVNNATDLGNDYLGFILTPSRSASPVKIPFYQPQQGIDFQSKLPVYKDYYADINCTEGSDIATVTGGAIPKVGSMVTGGAFDFGSKILGVNGSTIRVSSPANDTTDLPSNPTSIYTGFMPSYSDYFLGTYNNFVPCIDMLNNGISWFIQSSLTRRKSGSGSSAPQLLTESIDVPIALFGNNLRPTGNSIVKVYSPTKIASGSSSILGSYNFRIYHAAYANS